MFKMLPAGVGQQLKWALVLYLQCLFFFKMNYQSHSETES